MSESITTPVHAPIPAAKTAPAKPKTFDETVADIAADLGVENPRGNHEINLGCAHSLVQRTQQDLAAAEKYATKDNAQDYLSSLEGKAVGALFAAKLNARLTSDFCKTAGLPVPPVIAAVDAIKVSAPAK